jgi:hypothetical protein
MMLQNLPSILVAHALNPQPGDIILDMCPAPGGKTAYLANLVNNQATIVARNGLPATVYTSDIGAIMRTTIEFKTGCEWIFITVAANTCIKSSGSTSGGRVDTINRTAITLPCPTSSIGESSDLDTFGVPKLIVGPVSTH